MVSWRIRVMHIVLNSDKLEWMIRVAQPPESSLDQIQRGIRQEQESNTTLGQDFVAPAPSYIPIEVVSVSEWESTRLKRERLLELCLGQNRERNAAGILRRGDRMKKFSKEAEGRPKGFVEPRERWSGRISKSESEWWELSVQSIQLARKGWLFWERDCHFVEVFFHFERRRINNNQSQPSHRGTKEQRNTESVQR